MLDIILTENGMNFNRFEREFFKAGCELACKGFASLLEGLDKKLEAERDKSRYRHKGSRRTTLKTLMGEVSYSRTIYEHITDEGEKIFVYLLDEHLGFDGVGCVSSNLIQKIADNVSVTSFRNSAGNISGTTGQTISHGGVWNIVQALGSKLKAEEERLVLENTQGALIGEKEVKVLFEEADGVYINIQGKDRPKTGRKLEMKAGVAYEGWRKTGKERYELVNKIAYAGFENAREFQRKKEALIAKEYNIDEIEIRILNGDGAAWIKNRTEENIIYQLDPFHKHQAVIRKVSDKKHRTSIFKLLEDNKLDELLVFIDALANSTEDDKEEKKIRELYTYFYENKEGLTPYQQRGLNIPQPPEGLEYRHLGTMEHQICDMLAQRMKHRKASWSISSADNLGKLLALKVCKRLYQTIERISKTALPNTKTYGIIEELSAAQVPPISGRGKDGNIRKAHIPFTDCAISNGRKAIRKMFDIKGFYDLVYR